MTNYITRMNGIISSIIEKASKLSEDSKISKDASSKMSEEANDQSVSMGQIQETMSGISKAVGELAQNATELANFFKVTSSIIIASSKAGTNNLNSRSFSEM